MTTRMKEDYESLRGQPIVDKAPMAELPCIETSDVEKLCRHPVVSVHMLAYNHEKYIRQAIDSVLAQQTNFEFELVIGEDCSKDSTREICFEYQKKFPDKVRVLWSEQNVFAVDGNDTRTAACCRGEFIAYCEGDDYWTDPLKLQKQVDIMRAHPNVGLCFCGGDMFYENHGTMRDWPGAKAFPDGEMSGLKFSLWHIFGPNPRVPGKATGFLLTASTLIRLDVLRRACNEDEIFSWRLLLGDSTRWLGVCMRSDAYYLPDHVCVYRKCDEGITSSQLGPVCRDAMLVRSFFIQNGLRLSFEESGACWCDNIARTCYAQCLRMNARECRAYISGILSDPVFAPVFKRIRALPITLAMRLGIASHFLLMQFGRIYNRLMPRPQVPGKLADLYAKG